MPAGVEVIITGWFVSALLTKLVNLSSTYLKNQKEWQTGLKDELEKMKCCLPQIVGVVFAAEKRQIADQNPGLKDWLWNLNDALNEADDVLDELEYLRIKEEVDRKKNKLLASTSSFFKNTGKRVVNQNPTLKRLKAVVKNFDGIIGSIGPFLKLVEMEHSSISNSSSSHHNQRSRGPFLTIPVVGREEERRNLLNQLGCLPSCEPERGYTRVDKPSDEERHVGNNVFSFLLMILKWLLRIATTTNSKAEMQQQPGIVGEHVVVPNVDKDGVSVIVIVGEGGIGKTTLAQMVCEDREVKQHFEGNIWWITVSNDFDVDLLTKKIYRTAFKHEPSANDFDFIQKELNTKVESVKFLLVLDDVWNDNKGSWSRLMSPILKYGMPGSKILVTTRLQPVVQMVKTTNDPICLKRLEEGVYWELFRAICIPDQEDQENHPELLEVGKEIAKKLKGSPLAAKVVGGMLNDNLTEQYWNSIHETDMHNFDDIMSILKLSYLHLPPYLQPLFRYCSIFPPDYAFCKEKLACMWVAAGLIRQQNCQEEDVEDLGHRYFEDLLRRSFFIAHYEIPDTDYFMHDLLHDLVDDVSVGECCRVSGDRLVSIPTTTQHLSVVTKNISFFKKISQVKHLRTLHLSFDSSDIPNSSRALHQMFKSLTSIRVLNLSRTRVKQSICIDNMIHLRYLNAEVPIWTSVRSLYFLQFLTVDPPFSGSPVPAFDVVGLGNLTMLRQFKFALKKTKGYRISELRNLVELRSLGIENLETANSFKKAAAANMKGKQFIKDLQLSWGSCSNEENKFEQSNIAEKVFDGLEPHVDLKIMEISGYTGFRSPSWLRRGLEIRYEFKLEEIYINECSNWIDMSFLQHLPFLRVLKIENMGALNRIGTVEVPHGCRPFPKLRELTVDYCPMLKTLPPLPLGLKELNLRDVPLTTLPKWRTIEDNVAEEESNNETPWLCELVINNCRKLISLEEGLLQKNVKLHYLRKLIIRNCENVLHLPVDGFSKLRSLKRLDIDGCPKLLVPLAARHLVPTCVKNLDIENCGNLDGLLQSVMPSLTCLSKLRLSSCSSITSLDLSGSTALKHLTINDCQALASVKGPEKIPSLRELMISCCPRLGASTSHDIADYNTSSSKSLCKVIVDDPSLLRNVSILKGLTSVKILKIEDCSGLNSLTMVWPWLMQNRTSLQELWLLEAYCLESLPMDINNFNSLHLLEINNACALQSLPSLPKSLKRLYISKCSDAFETRYGSHRRDIKRIPYCHISSKGDFD